MYSDLFLLVFPAWLLFSFLVGVLAVGAVLVLVTLAFLEAPCPGPCNIFGPSN